MSVSVLSPAQFKGKRSLRRDPTSDRRKARFSGSAGPKTMKLARGRGLPSAPTRHGHNENAVQTAPKAR